MHLHILTNGVLGEPITIPASLVVVYSDDGTPIMVAGEYGPDGAVRASHALDKDFNSTLHALGINRTVLCDKVALPPPPPGARLIRQPLWTPPGT